MALVVRGQEHVALLALSVLICLQAVVGLPGAGQEVQEAEEE